MGKIVLRLDRIMVERKMSLNELAEKVGFKLRGKSFFCVLYDEEDW